MKRFFASTLLVGLLVASAQRTPSFQWKAGTTTTYTVQQTTTIRQLIPGPENTAPAEGQTITKLALLKRWQVVSVDEAGVATVRLTVPQLRMEFLGGDSTPIVYDSANPAGSDEALSKEMGKYVNSELAEVRIDARGQIVEVKASDFGPGGRLKADLPFKIVFPEGAIDQPWTRDYQIKFDPPQGAGETFDATQTYTKVSHEGALLTLSLKTELKSKPTPDEEIPLLPFVTEGDVYFDTQSGRYHGAKLRTEREVIGHRGAGSKYHYESSYIEAAVQQ